MAKTNFGSFLRELRLHKGFGLRAFAKEIGWLPSNLSHTETGRINPPRDSKVLRHIAKILGLKEGTADWGAFFDLAAKDEPTRVPADVADFVREEELAPIMLRTVANKKLTRAQIEKLIEKIKKL